MTKEKYLHNKEERNELQEQYIIKVINEALVKPDTIELAPTRRLGLDACSCTGNSFC